MVVDVVLQFLVSSHCHPGAFSVCIMKALLPFLLIAACSVTHAANISDGRAGNGLYLTAANWDNDALPGFSGTVSLPAAAPNKQVSLGGSGIAHERVAMVGGYRVFNGRIVVAGGGSNAEIESIGYKTELGGTLIDTRNGGRIEILGIFS